MGKHAEVVLVREDELKKALIKTKELRIRKIELKRALQKGDTMCAKISKKRDNTFERCQQTLFSVREFAKPGKKRKNKILSHAAKVQKRVDESRKLRVVWSFSYET